MIPGLPLRFHNPFTQSSNQSKKKKKSLSLKVGQSLLKLCWGKFYIVEAPVNRNPRFYLQVSHFEQCSKA